MSEDYYGKITDDSGSLDRLNSKIEELGSPAFRKLIENPSEFTGDDWETVAWVLANIFVRAPTTIEAISETLGEMTDQASELATKMRERLFEALEAGSDLSEFPTDPFKDDSPTSTVEEMVEGVTRMRAPGGHRLTATTLFSAIEDIARIIQRMKFTIILAPEGEFFITSDVPLILRSKRTGSPEGMGWASPEVQATIPLHPTSYLFMSHGNGPSIEVLTGNSKAVRELNSATLIFANQEIYSPQEIHEAMIWMAGED